jgi:hypothetical protein
VQLFFTDQRKVWKVGQVAGLSQAELSALFTRRLVPSGTPILLDEAMRPVEPVSSWFRSLALERKDAKTSLRAFTHEAVLTSQNVVDDIDHVCLERTSLDLAQQLSGGGEFIDATPGQVLREPEQLRRRPEKPLLFSPFGLGVLDRAVGGYVRRRAAESGPGIDIDDFSPTPAVR